MAKNEEEVKKQFIWFW
ncbi:Protein of unknown function [Lactobacillus helveticus CIRM-BIA 101]|uniref:Uncharacterized protein n=2 Tax=Lactobacillus helveticus TaxID=1587 RepID=U6F8Q0_LACHE|nr:Protein of unknown function [Lactobacillus helveticus CIRM-BIA 951]CDI60347.1 Protein of unknown function [Lactobacillus helveticus CIRM-BIA 104]CDI62462.1 Protein of unknown function [Lactobacillus helveticus CIRM-BIA 103]CDI65948.1 Protein of unknown function [Lactobacillus helveticus CIRM-BIA 101]